MTLKVGVSEWEEYQQKIYEARKELWTVFNQWQPVANRMVAICQQLAENLVEIRRKVNVLRLTGSGVSLGVGVPMMVAGTILIPFTVGVSSLLIGMGTGISVLGGMTAGGATLTEFSLRSKKMKELQDLQVSLEEISPNLEAASVKLHALLLTSFHLFSNSKTLPHLPGNCQKLQVFSRTVWTLLTMGGAALRIASSTGDDMLKLIGAGTELGTALTTTSARIAFNSLFAAVAAAVDLYTILDSSRNMVGCGNRYEAVKKLEEIARKVEGIRGQILILLNRADGIAEGNIKDVMGLAKDMFSCYFCLCVSQPPLVQCPVCCAWIGCEKCLSGWLAEASLCPKCETRWPTDVITDDQRVNRCENLLIELRNSDRNT